MSRSTGTALLVGHTSSAAYGHHLGRAIAMGYVRHEGGVDADYVAAGKWEIDVGLKTLRGEGEPQAALRPHQCPNEGVMP